MLLKQLDMLRSICLLRKRGFISYRNRPQGKLYRICPWENISSRAKRRHRATWHGAFLQVKYVGFSNNTQFSVHRKCLPNFIKPHCTLIQLCSLQLQLLYSKTATRQLLPHIFCFGISTPRTIERKFLITPQ